MTKKGKLTAAFVLAAALAIPAGIAFAQDQTPSCQTDKDSLVNPVASISVTHQGRDIKENGQSRLGINFKQALKNGEIIVIHGSSFVKTPDCDTLEFGFVAPLDAFEKADDADIHKVKMVIFDLNGAADNKDMPVFPQGELDVNARPVTIADQEFSVEEPREPMSADTVNKI